MFKRQLLAAMIAATAGAVGLTGLEGPAQAAPLPINSQLPDIITWGDGFQTVATAKERRKDRKEANQKRHRKEVAKKRYWRYSSREHGKRYRYKRPGYVYYYGGYWYPRPFWTFGPGLIIQIN